MTVVDASTSRLRAYYEKQLRDWPDSEPVNAAQILARDERLRDNASIVIDLAYEEFCQRLERGESLDRRSFAARFPDVEQSLARLLALHTFLDHPSRNWEDSTKAKWPIVGESVSGFELVEELGRGAFSRVYLARDLELGSRTVVVKFSTRGGMEAAALGKLEHPNIVRVHSARLEGGFTLICMPFEGRRTLLDVIEEVESRPNGIAESSVVEWGVKLALGLSHAHDQGLLHCDVKPSNVLLREDGEPVLLDFNLSRDIAEEREVAGGTIPYMAPEQVAQILGEDREVGPAADVYGLAATMYHLVVGEPPFAVHAGTSLEAALAERSTFSASKLRAQCTPQLAVSISRALAYAPEMRPASCHEFAELLRSCRPRRSNRVRAGLAAAAILGVAGALVLTRSPDQSNNERAPVSSNGGVAPVVDRPFEPAEEYARASALQRRQEWARALSAYQPLLRRSADDLAGVDPAMVVNGARICLLADSTASKDQSLVQQLESADGSERDYLGEVADQFVEVVGNLRSPERDQVQGVWLAVRNMIGKGNRDPRTRAALAVLAMLMSQSSDPANALEADRLRAQAQLHSRIAIDAERSSLGMGD